jgi:hypothetical protein
MMPAAWCSGLPIAKRKANVPVFDVSRVYFEVLALDFGNDQKFRDSCGEWRRRNKHDRRLKKNAGKKKKKEKERAIRFSLTHLATY